MTREEIANTVRDMILKSAPSDPATAALDLGFSVLNVEAGTKDMESVLDANGDKWRVVKLDGSLSINLQIVPAIQEKECLTQVTLWP